MTIGRPDTPDARRPKTRVRRRWWLTRLRQNRRLMCKALEIVRVQLRRSGAQLPDRSNGGGRRRVRNGKRRSTPRKRRFLAVVSEGARARTNVSESACGGLPLRQPPAVE